MSEDINKKIVELAGQDKILGSTIRLSIMTLLYLNGKMKFTELKRILKLTSGNLSVHLKKLDAAGYVKIEKTFLNLKPATLVVLTKKGAKKLLEFYTSIKDIADALKQ